MSFPDKIKWRNFSDVTFAEAEKEKKPILLGISAVWCHWCHVMDNNTYSDDNLADFINKNFIPVRVDTDKRPEINTRYNMGGWPTTVVLTPQGKAIDGATYIHPERMQRFLQSSLDIYKSIQEEEIKVPEPKLQEEPKEKIDEDKFLQDVKSKLAESFDQTHAGFGTSPKFPHPEALNYLILLCKHEKDEKLKEMLGKTLISMREGEFFDKEEFGFFRYCTQQDWSVPHYEKMLEDNAHLIPIYLSGFSIFKDEKFKNIALQTLDYLFENLFDKDNSVFYGSQDADEDYYRLSKAERTKVQKPFIDKTIYIDWNALMCSSLFKAFSITGNNYYKTLALKNLDFLLKNSFDNNTVFHYFPRDKETPNTILKDYALLLRALIDAYNFTFDKNYLEQAKKLFEIINSKFYDKDKGAYFDTIPNENAKGLLAINQKQLPENSLMINNIKKLQFLLDNPDLLDFADKTKEALLGKASKLGFFAACFAEAMEIDNYFLEAKIIGKKEDELFKEFHSKLLSNYGPEIAILSMPETEAKQLGLKAPVLMPCKAGICLKPIYDSAALTKLFS